LLVAGALAALQADFGDLPNIRGRVDFEKFKGVLHQNGILIFLRDLD
jgi:hypothetical protein